MTREEAIDLLDNLIGMIEDNHNSDYDKALKMAIKSLEQEPCEDAISRQAVLDGIDTYINKTQSTGTQDDFYSFAELVVKELPSVTPQEPFINKPCVASQVCHEDKVKVLEKIRAEIDKARYIDKDTRICKNALASGLEVALQIIDKYKAEQER